MTNRNGRKKAPHCRGGAAALPVAARPGGLPGTDLDSVTAGAALAEYAVIL